MMGNFMEQTGWLVERDGKWWGPTCSQWQWEHALTGCEPPLWTSDANKALRFARQEDAEAFIRWKSLSGGAKATEHIWIDNVPLDAAAREAAIKRFGERLTKMMADAAERITKPTTLT
jgi:hypothetical protein